MLVLYRTAEQFRFISATFRFFLCLLLGAVSVLLLGAKRRATAAWMHSLGLRPACCSVPRAALLRCVSLFRAIVAHDCVACEMTHAVSLIRCPFPSSSSLTLAFTSFHQLCCNTGHRPDETASSSAAFSFVNLYVYPGGASFFSFGATKPSIDGASPSGACSHKLKSSIERGERMEGYAALEQRSGCDGGSAPGHVAHRRRRGRGRRRLGPRRGALRLAGFDHFGRGHGDGEVRKVWEFGGKVFDDPRERRRAVDDVCEPHAVARAKAGGVDANVEGHKAGGRRGCERGNAGSTAGAVVVGQSQREEGHLTEGGAGVERGGGGA